MKVLQFGNFFGNYLNDFNLGTIRELLKGTQVWEQFWETFKGKCGSYFENHSNGLQFGKYLNVFILGTIAGTIQRDFSLRTILRTI